MDTVSFSDQMKTNCNSIMLYVRNDIKSKFSLKSQIP